MNKSVECTMSVGVLCSDINSSGFYIRGMAARLKTAPGC